MNCTWSLPAWPAPTTRFLDVVGAVFGDLQPGLRRRQQRHGAGMAELQRGGRILGDKGLFHRDGRGRDARAITAVSSRCSAISRAPRPDGGAGGDHAMGDMGKPGALKRHHAPAHAGQAGIKAENANRAGHGRFVPFMFLAMARSAITPSCASKPATTAAAGRLACDCVRLLWPWNASRASRRGTGTRICAIPMASPSWRATISAGRRSVSRKPRSRHDYVNGCDTFAGRIPGRHLCARGQPAAAAWRGRWCQAVEDWTRTRGCSELASDAWLDTSIPTACMRALGFPETERVVYFRKTWLNQPAWPSGRRTTRNCHRRSGHRHGRPELRSA